MAADTLQVRVVSPSPLLGEALARLLCGMTGFEAAWEPVDAVEERTADGGRPDLVLVELDGNDPPPDLGARIDQRWPGVLTAVLVRPGSKAVRAAALVGAAGTLTGRLDARDLAVSLRRIHEHGRLHPGTVPGRREPQAADPERSAVARLTERETEVLRLLAAGLAAPDIAQRLGLSANTLRAHVQNTLLKLNVHSRLEAVAVARRVGLVNGSPGPALVRERSAHLDGRRATARPRRTHGGTVVVADGRPLVRAALRAGLDAEEGLAVVADAGSTAEAVDACRRLAPDVVVLDSQLPPDGGVAACALIKSDDVPTRILVVSERPDEDCLLATVEAGGDGFSEWSGGLAGLGADVRRLTNGEACIPPGMLGVLLRRLIQRGRDADEAVDRFSRLSRREREILVLMVEGLDNQGIARALVISPHTARTHVQNVLAKLDVHSRGEAAAIALEYGLIERFMGAS